MKPATPRLAAVLCVLPVLAVSGAWVSSGRGEPPRFLTVAPVATSDLPAVPRTRTQAFPAVRAASPP